MKKLISVLLILTMLFAFLSFGTSAADVSYIFGDVDGDGKVDSSDALLILEYYIGEKDLSASQKKLADVDGNGKINSADALSVLMYKTELISTFDGLNKSKYVDPIVDSGVYTMNFTTSFNDVGEEMLNGKEVDMTITTDGVKRTTAIKLKITVDDLDKMGIEASEAEKLLMVSLIGGAMEMRYFKDSDGKKYALMSAGSILKQYTDFEGDDMGDMLTQAMFADGFKYAETVDQKIGSENYTCEKYVNEQGSELYYCFIGTSLKMIQIGSGTNAQIFKINSLKNTADTSLLQIPKGYQYSKDMV